ncbi:gluconokinase [Klenkia taihuensis]|uniref:Gluconokinase n=1 Tax=Klenkia taihuensis TaxID=1225127 RepID=A0A1I1SEK8_9ACTN|nr:gluconokinase [Klenkia taihuensis]GHE13689.1 gluconokinase [Klenkia taihuensis]SFD41430.1 gluconate kinase, SKI family [Klenkia taihuensis]
MADTDAPPTTVSVVVMGVSGTGKSTVGVGIAQTLGCDFVEGDDLHPPANVEKMRSGTPLDDEDRWPWLRAVAARVGEHEAAGTDLVITCSALKRAYRDLLREQHPSVWFAHIDTPHDVLVERLRRRTGHYMPGSLLDSQLATLEPLADDEPGHAYSGQGSPEQTVEALVRELRAERPQPM